MGLLDLDSQSKTLNSKLKISIIVPTLNEAANIHKTIAKAKESINTEIIVVDGGSQDETVDIAREMGVQTLITKAGRGNQMNAGALVATGEIFIFLHADTLLPSRFDMIVRQALSEEGALAGAFELKIDSSELCLRLIEKGANWRARLLLLPYGDQAIFVWASIFKKIGGFADMPIMEDFHFMRKLQPLGKIKIVPYPVLTSARRWQKLGVLKTTLLNQLVIIAYFLGVPPHSLAKWYRQGGFLRKSESTNS